MQTLERQYFPAVCSLAHRPFLALLVGPRGEALSPRCPTCGAPARIISGLHYAAREPRFELTVDAVLQHRIALDDARGTLVELERLVRLPEPELRRGLLRVLNAVSFEHFEPESHDELLAFARVLSGVLSVQSEAVTPVESSLRRVDGGDPPEDGAVSEAPKTAS